MPTFLDKQQSNVYHRFEIEGRVSSMTKQPQQRVGLREFKYYRLTDRGRKELVVGESQWKQMAEAVARVTWPAAEEN